MIAHVAIVGAEMEREKMFIGELLMTTKATNANVRILNPQLAVTGRRATRQVVIGNMLRANALIRQRRSSG